MLNGEISEGAVKVSVAAESYETMWFIPDWVAKQTSIIKLGAVVDVHFTVGGQIYKFLLVANSSFCEVSFRF